jgi:CHAD domain-containing protein
MNNLQNTYSGFVQYVFPQYTQELEGLLKKARKDPESEVVHNLRVCARRCRQMIGIVRAFLPYGAYKSTGKFLDGLVSQFSSLRNRDVFKEYLEELKSHPQASRFPLALQNLLKGERRKRLKQSRKFRSFWKDPFFQRGNQIFEGVSQLLPPTNPNGDVRKKLVSQMRRQHDAALKEVRSQCPALFSQNDDKTLHGFRAALRRLRYTSEIVAHLSGTPGPSAMNRMKAWQTDVGCIHDLDVFLTRVQKRSAKVLSFAEDFLLVKDLNALERHLLRERAGAMRQFLKNLRRDRHWLNSHQAEPDWKKLNSQ